MRMSGRGIGVGSLHRFCVGRQTELTVVAVYVITDLGKGLSFASHAHRVTRDVHTDASAQTMIVKDDGPVGIELLHETVQVALVADVATTAVAGDLGQDIRAGYRKPVGLLYYWWGRLHPIREYGNRCQLNLECCRFPLLVVRAGEGPPDPGCCPAVAPFEDAVGQDIPRGGAPADGIRGGREGLAILGWGVKCRRASL